jgi:hypothetical protein
VGQLLGFSYYDDDVLLLLLLLPLLLCVILGRFPSPLLL